MKYLLLLLAFSANAQPMQSERVKDWIALDIRYSIVPHSEFVRWCPPLTAACAIPLFHKRECWIVMLEYDDMLAHHERLHCYGFDHVGESTMRDLWENYKSRYQARGK
jgi:hypothetical protein